MRKLDKLLFHIAILLCIMGIIIGLSMIMLSFLSCQTKKSYEYLDHSELKERKTGEIIE